MSVVQTTYPNVHEGFVDGQIADTSTADIDSYFLTGTGSDVPFGRAISVSNVAGAGDKDAVPYAGARFAGIAIQDERLKASSGESYKTGDPVSTLWRGDVVVLVSAAVANGNAVSIATVGGGTGDTLEVIGQLSAKTADATHIALAGAVFLSTAVAQGLATVRLAGPAPVA